MSSGETRQSRVQAWFAGLSGWRAPALAAGAGAFAALGYAPLYFFPAFAAGIVVLIWLLDAAMDQPRRMRAFFACGWWWGLGHIGLGMHWIASPFMVEPETWGWMAPPAVLFFAAGLALFYGAGCALAAPFWTRDVRRLAVFAVALGASEWLRGHIFSGFPWNLPGYVWEAGTPVSQVAAFVGIYGLSLLTLLFAAAPAAIADGGAKPGQRFAPMIAAALALGLLFGAGQSRIGRAPVAIPGETPIVRVTDAGLGQAEKWQDRPDQEWRVLDAYLDATGTQDESSASVVVWPEGAIPAINFLLLEQPNFLQAIGQGLGDRALILGFTRRAPLGDRFAFYNSAGVIDGVSGQARVSPQVYDKHHLVPFGEYIPLWPVVRGALDLLRSAGLNFDIRPLQQIGEAFTSGDAPARMVVPAAPPAVILICYEAIFPGMTPRGLERPGWIVSVSNDAWFGGWMGPWQHFNIASYRAIEEGLPMARAASGGISAIIDSTGRPVRLTHRKGGFAEAQLPRAAPETVFANWGALLTAALFACIALLRFSPTGDGLGKGLKS